MIAKLKIWVMASRPKTLVAGIAPVIIAIGLSISKGIFKWYLSLICLLLAVLFQIASNFANDYFDYKKGSDNSERLGPKRAVAEGLVSPQQMLYATFIVIFVASLLGIILMWLISWQLIFIGIAIAIFVIAYSGGSYPLSYHGWGDVCVLIFFGIIPVVFTCYVQLQEFKFDIFLCGMAIGLVAVNILVTNNYRDYSTDKKANKRTTVVIFGKRFAEYFYLINGLIAVLLCQYFWFVSIPLAAVLPLFYLLPHMFVWYQMKTIMEGKALISILEKTAMNTIIFSLLLFTGLVLG